jgi:hypothetical protein
LNSSPVHSRRVSAVSTLPSFHHPRSLQSNYFKNQIMFRPATLLRSTGLRPLNRLPQARSLARLTLVGRLPSPPQLEHTSTGKDIIKYSIATSRGTRENQHTSWWKIVAFEGEGPRRDRLLGLPKGTLLAVEGDASMSSWVTQSGENRKMLNVVQSKSWSCFIGRWRELVVDLFANVPGIC